VGKMAHGPNRKGILKAARAFLRAFPTERDVELRLKCLPDCLSLLGDLPSDPRIKLTSEPLSAPDMADWCRACTAGVLATSGEGFGLPGLQFMALGRPVVMPEATGQASYFDGRFGYAVPWRWAHAGDYFTGTGGSWAEPDPEGLEAGLRWVYENPDEAREKGRAGALRALEFTWQHSARALRKALVEFGLIPNPHRERIAKVKACPHRSDAPGCGCSGGGICKAGKGEPRDGFVALATCLTCLGESVDG
jgi:glycosyltransferase involved in cell wall biosynthesis